MCFFSSLTFLKLNILSTFKTYCFWGSLQQHFERLAFAKATEFFGGLFLLLGFLKRPACIFLIIDMAVATFVVGKGHLMQDGRTPSSF